MLGESRLAEVSIVIPVATDLRLRACLDSIDEAVETVVVLNGASEEVRTLAHRHPAGAVVVESDRPRNLGAAYERGIRAATGRYILLMDSDCIFVPGAIRAMAGRAHDAAVLKGRIVYDRSRSRLGRAAARMREFDQSGFVSAYSPPLLFDRRLAERVGGYLFLADLPWCEDRDFDFRLQLAGIAVESVSAAVISHGSQPYAAELRSYWRYGVGQAVGEELGIFLAPTIPGIWRILDVARAVVACARDSGPLAAFAYGLGMCCFCGGLLTQRLYRVYRIDRRRRRIRVLVPPSEHGTKLSRRQVRRLRAAYTELGIVINHDGGRTTDPRNGSLHNAGVSPPPVRFRTRSASVARGVQRSAKRGAGSAPE